MEIGTAAFHKVVKLVKIGSAAHRRKECNKMDNDVKALLRYMEIGKVYNLRTLAWGLHLTPREIKKTIFKALETGHIQQVEFDLDISTKTHYDYEYILSGWLEKKGG